MIAILCQMIKNSLLLIYSLRVVSAAMSLLLSALTGIGQIVSLNGRQVFFFYLHHYYIKKSMNFSFNISSLLHNFSSISRLGDSLTVCLNVNDQTKCVLAKIVYLFWCYGYPFVDFLLQNNQYFLPMYLNIFFLLCNKQPLCP